MDIKKFRLHWMRCEGEFFVMPILSFSTDKTIQGSYYAVLGWGFWAVMVSYDEPSWML